ncbi:Uma2 family endonuclease [Streptomyces sp. NPDC048751]|uniref:Uma2 family endonuclease n=1 Tax=Streptomyces sp. NPDC048751 TaxID=3365591 RepID=UPI003722CDB5
MPDLTDEKLRQAGEVVLEGFLQLEPPEGFRAQLLDGQILVTPPPDGFHEHCLSEIIRQVVKKSGTRMDFSGNKGLKLPSRSAHPDDHVIPDNVLCPDAAQLFRGAAPWMPPDGVTLVVEVTFLYPHVDREAKRRCYARAGIPLYLLVDREASATTLFMDPVKDDYREHHTRPFGKPITLPEPFAFGLDTSEFL